MLKRFHGNLYSITKTTYPIHTLNSLSLTAIFYNFFLNECTFRSSSVFEVTSQILRNVRKYYHWYIVTAGIWTSVNHTMVFPRTDVEISSIGDWFLSVFRLPSNWGIDYSITILARFVLNNIRIFSSQRLPTSKHYETPDRYFIKSEHLIGFTSNRILIITSIA